VIALAIVVDVKNKLIDFIPESEDEGKITLSLREFWDLVLEVKELLKNKRR